MTHILDEIRQLKGLPIEGKPVDPYDQQATEMREALVKKIWESDWHPDSHDAAHTSAVWNEQFTDAIIDSLSFESMDDRADLVPAAYERTFDWIFRRPGNKMDDRSIVSQDEGTGFAGWLEGEDTSIYWIEGKPGSGKSTLVKYIVGHPSVPDLLEIWAGRINVKPLWAGYYFWDAGSNPLQKSRLGMIRTLLYQCLRQRPDLLPTVSPRRWALYASLHNSVFTPPSWTWEELNDTFALLTAMSGKDFRLALFIDGLDEFDGRPEKIISFIEDVNSKHNVKICVASRPWEAFRDAFQQGPSLAMQKLTKNDITTYIRGRFARCEAFNERKAVSSAALDQLLKDIALKAKGVFLWVSIVVRLLIQDMVDGRNLDQLQKTLGSLPDDISRLYTEIWQSIDPGKIEASSRFLQIKIATTNIMRLDAELMWLTDEKRLPLGIDPREVLDAIKPILTRKLASFTKGVLEISSSGTVEFLHRTAHDWSQQPDTWSALCENTKVTADFDPSLALLRAFITHLLPQILSDTRANNSMWLRYQLLPPLTLAGNVVDRPETTEHLIEALDELNRVLSKFDSEFIRSSTHWSSKITGGDLSVELENCFVGLAASFAITPYVREKILRHPGLLAWNARDNQVSLLENSICGWTEVLNIDFATHYSRGLQAEIEKRLPQGYKGRVWFCSERRLGMIKTVLEAGASPEMRACLTSTGSVTIRKRVAELSAESESEWCDEDGYFSFATKAYWDEVSALMESHKASSTVTRIRSKYKTIRDKLGGRA